MNAKKIFGLIGLILISGCALFSCGDNDKHEEEVPSSTEILNNIIGNWLLASSNADEWATYDFSETSRVKASFYEESRLMEGSGFYWVDDDKNSITANIDLGNGKIQYLDWIVDTVKPFEIAVKLYEDDKYFGDASLYRIISTMQIEAGSSNNIDFKTLCGTDNVSDFTVIDNKIATIENDGKVSGLKIGETFMTFNTKNGHAAVLLTVLPAPKTFAQLVLGTWIYDKLSDKEWQRTTFYEDGIINVLWANYKSYTTIESADGTYNLSDNKCSFSVKTHYGTQYNLTWITEEINDLIWTYNAFSHNESMGKYTGQKLLGTVTLNPGENFSPDYSELTFGYQILGFESKNNAIARVDASNGVIEAVDYGRTYIDVQTPIGAGVFEVYVK